MNTDELVNEDDIAAALTEAPTPSKGRGRGRGRGQRGGAQAASALLASADSMSARERNKLKRKAKALQRQDSMVGQTSGEIKSRVRPLRCCGLIHCRCWTFH